MTLLCNWIQLKHANLTKLSLQNCGINTSGFIELLHSIESSEKALAIADASPINQRLQLLLSSNPLGVHLSNGDALFQVIDRLCSISCLSTLDISFCGMSQMESVQLIQGVTTNTSVLTRVQFNEIGLLVFSVE